MVISALGVIKYLEGLSNAAFCHSRSSLQLTLKISQETLASFAVTSFN